MFCDVMEVWIATVTEQVESARECWKSLLVAWGGF
jgi:hypothetical protein